MAYSKWASQKVGVILWVLMGLLAGCAPHSDRQSQNPSSSPSQHQNFRVNREGQIDKDAREQRSRLSEQGHFRVSYTPEPDPVPLNQYFRLKVQVQNSQNQLLDDVNIAVDAGMPEHNHGMNSQPEVKKLGPGVFEVRGLLFHMPGYWEIYVDVMQDGRKERAIFGLTLDMKPTQKRDQSMDMGQGGS